MNDQTGAMQTNIDQLWANQKALGESVNNLDRMVSKLLHIMAPEQYPDPELEAKNEEPEGTPSTETVPA